MGICSWSHELPPGENHPIKAVGHHIETKKFEMLIWEAGMLGERKWRSYTFLQVGLLIKPETEALMRVTEVLRSGETHNCQGREFLAKRAEASFFPLFLCNWAENRAVQRVNPVDSWFFFQVRFNSTLTAVLLVCVPHNFSEWSWFSSALSESFIGKVQPQRSSD